MIKCHFNQFWLKFEIKISSIKNCCKHCELEIDWYLTFWILADIQIFTDILVYLSTAQFEPNSSWLSKNLQIILNFKFKTAQKQ